MNIQSLIEKITNHITEHDFSGVIHITQGNHILFSQAQGYANRAEKIPNRIDTAFAIASGTKLFTALAAGCLIDDGLLSLDSKAFDLFEHSLDSKLYDPRITVAQIMSHTSGMPDYLDEYLEVDFDHFELSVPNHKLMTPLDYLPTFPKRDKKFEPGTKFNYCNGAYIVLSAIIENLAKTTFQAFVEERVLKPLEMNHSGFYKMNALPANTALGYIIENNEFLTNIYNVPIIGAGDGGMFTTAPDMVNLWTGLYENKLLSQSLKDIYFTPHMPMNEEETYFAGLGHFIRKVQGGYTRYISGGDAGVSFDSAYNEPNDILFTVISNQSDQTWALSNLFQETID